MDEIVSDRLGKHVVVSLNDEGFRCKRCGAIEPHLPGFERFPCRTDYTTVRDLGCTHLSHGGVNVKQ